MPRPSASRARTRSPASSTAVTSARSSPASSAIPSAAASAAVLLLDLDHFKRVNDEHGHLMGDAVLQTVTDRIASVLRSEDCLARWGGEEFAVLAPDDRS